MRSRQRGGVERGGGFRLGARLRRRREQVAALAVRSGRPRARGSRRSGCRGSRRELAVRLDLIGVDAGFLGDPSRQRAEFHRLEKGDEVLVVRLVHGEVFDRHLELDVLVERDQPLGNARDFRIVDQRLPSLVLFDLAGAQEQGFQIAILDDELCCRLDADAGHARHIVARVADQRLDLDHLLGADAELLDHLGAADALVLHRVVHGDAVVHELHQVLVRRHDGRRRLRFAGEAGVGGDDVVGLESGLLQAGDVEGAHRLADQRELRDQIARDVRPLRLVFGIEIGAEGLFRLVEHHREVRRPLLRLHVVEQLPQHVAEAEHGVDLQAVRLAGERRQRVVGAEDVARAVDQEDVVALFEGTDDRGGLGGGFGGRGLCGRGLGDRRFGFGWHGPNVGLDTGFGNARVHSVMRCSLVGIGIPPAAWPHPRRPEPRPVRPLEQEAEPRVADRPVPGQRADDANRRHQQRDRAEIGDDAGLEQRDAGRRHRQEEGEIDDDGVLAAIAQRLEHVAPRHQRRDHDHRAGADEAERQRDERPVGIAAEHERAIDDGPDRERGQRMHRLVLHAGGEREDVRRKDIAGVEIDEAMRELVDHGPAGVDVSNLSARNPERGADEPDRQPRQPAGELHDDEEDRQQVDEPQRAERLDEGFEIGEADAAPAHFADEHRRLEGELDRHPQHVEIGEVDDLLVEIVAPVAVDDAGEEQPRDQEEVRHAEGPGEGDRGMHPALAAGRLLDAERRMHHHHHDDAEALGVIDPIDPTGLRHDSPLWPILRDAPSALLRMRSKSRPHPEERPQRASRRMGGAVCRRIVIRVWFRSRLRLRETWASTSRQPDPPLLRPAIQPRELDSLTMFCTSCASQ